MLSRTLFISVSLLFASLFSLQAHATTFKIASVAPDGSMWMTLMKQGAKKIASETGDRVKFKFYPGGVMGNQETVIRKMRIRQLHGAGFTSGVLGSFYPDSQIYSLPLTYKSLDEIDYVRKHMDEKIIKGLDEAGIVILGITEGGMVYTMSGQPVHRIEDFPQRKVWSPTNNKNVELTLQAIDVAPVPLPISDVLVGLQTGLIDTVASSPSAAIVLQWHTEIKYITDIPLMYFYSVLALDKKAFNKLSDGDKKIVRRIMKETISKIDENSRKDNIAALQALKSQGIEILQPDNDVLQQWYHKGDDATQLIFDNGNLSQESVDTLLSLLEQYRNQQAKFQ